MLEERMPRFEPHPIIFEFLDTITSGKAAPLAPAFLHRALARGAVSLVPDMVRQRLGLGSDWDLTAADRTALRLGGLAIDRTPNPMSPAWQAARRLGLPGNFSWLAPDRQAALLRGHGS